MTFLDLVRNADELVDDTFSDAQYLAWFQACQSNELLTYLYLPTKAVLTRVDDYFQLPSNFKNLIKIEESADLGTYDIFADKVYVDSDSALTEITIRYDRFPTAISNATDFVPDIPEQFHSLYYFYAAMTSQFSDDESERMTDARTLFHSGLATLAKFMSKKRAQEGKFNQWEVRR